ncbi:NUDIX domain-containing protein [Fontimonas sp. SYSU GA230001]|uniref:NUDIX domain-containing protein n=1 Tax=Fontimonas sp. SYSU GA230001 TaxID=3142450 RepID=UPI0032B5C888
MTAFKFCPRCARPLIEREQGGLVRRVCPDQACGFVHWDNPTPVVAAVVEHEGQIVLARNALWPQRFFGLITGFLERNEDPAEAVLREVEEELGLKAQSPAFIGHYTFERMNQLIVAYHVVAEGEIVLNEELSEYIRVAPEKARYWPAATGLALRDWLHSRGYQPELIDLSPRGKGG